MSGPLVSSTVQIRVMSDPIGWIGLTGLLVTVRSRAGTNKRDGKVLKK